MVATISADIVRSTSLQTEDLIVLRNRLFNLLRVKRWSSGWHYVHAAIVFALSWLVSFRLEFWWCALVIAVTHFAIDMWKSYREDKVKWFVADQLLHIAILIVVAWLWYRCYDWSVPFGIPTKYIALAVAIANVVIFNPALMSCVDVKDYNIGDLDINETAV